MATLIAGASKLYGFSSTPNIALAASVLLLAPGFAFVNSFLDSFKGYMMMGWGRWMEGTILTLATSVGIIFAISLFNVLGLILFKAANSTAVLDARDDSNSIVVSISLFVNCI